MINLTDQQWQELRQSAGAEVRVSDPQTRKEYVLVSSEVYDRLKVIAGLKKACEKRPVSMELIEQTGDRIERMLQERGEKEVSASVIGEAIMKALYDLDKVAYVRFASVYRSFEDVNEFMRELKDLIQTSREEPAKKSPRAKGKARA